MLYSSKHEALKRYKKTGMAPEKYKYKLYVDGSIVNMQTYKIVGYVNNRKRIYELLDLHPATFQKEIRIELNIL